MPPKRNVLGAMFDVQPKDQSGVLDLEKVNKPKARLNLRPAGASKTVARRRISDDFFALDATLTASPVGPSQIEDATDTGLYNNESQSDHILDVSRVQTAVGTKKQEIEDFESEGEESSTEPPKSSEDKKDKILREIEVIVSSSMNVTAEVVKFGGKLHFNNVSKPAPRNVDHFTDWLIANPAPKEKIQPSIESESVVANQEPVVSNLEKFVSEEEPVLAAVEYPASEVIPQPTDLLSVWFNDSSKSKKSNFKGIFSSEKSKNEIMLLDGIKSEAGKATAVTASTRRPWPSSSGQKLKTPSYISGRKFTKPRRNFWFKIPSGLLSRKSALVSGIIIAVIFAGFQFLSQSETDIKNNVTQNGKNAVANLMDAREKLLGFDFAGAANDFALADDDFSKAGSRLDKVGAIFAPIFAHIPGLNKLTAATNLVIAGQNISQAGADMSSALNDLTKLRLSAFINPERGETKQSLYQFLEALRDLIDSSQDKVDKAGSLLASVNESMLPEDKRDLFVLFKDKLPELTEFFDKSNDYLDVLLDLVGEKGTKNYLVLLQNNSELRATGGFPGSYAIISIQDGFIKEIKIDDTYNPDGQLHDNLIPPKPLQHITPTWGMRDANWFADFPTSAKKVIDSYSKSTGMVVDGVLTLTPDVITDILAIMGPIEMPEYGMTLNADNFLPEIQEEVEYGPDKADNRPKKILMDFQPKFLTKLTQQDKGHLMEISQVLSDAFLQKRILAYFINSDAQKLAVAKDFAGELKDFEGDYLQVNISNIKGFKTDLVTKTVLDLNTNIDTQGNAEHELAVTRTHNGGKLDQKFYNQPNPAYMRVYAPLGAEFESIAGNTWTTYEPLVDYSQSIFKSDPDLAVIEEGTRNPVFAVDVFEESGKTVFGFWLVVNPGKTKTVILKYKVPHAYGNNEYNLYVQKQSGTRDITLNAVFKLPAGKKPVGYLPSDMVETGSGLMLTADLNSDQNISIGTK